MTKGHVDEAWARSHHDRWYAEVKAAEAGGQETQTDGGGGTATGVTSPVHND